MGTGDIPVWIFFSGLGIAFINGPAHLYALRTPGSLVQDSHIHADFIHQLEPLF